MSKASEWAARGGDRPELRRGRVRARAVMPRGPRAAATLKRPRLALLYLAPGTSKGYRAMDMSDADALALAAWIIDAFSDTPTTPPAQPAVVEPGA